MRPGTLLYCLHKAGLVPFLAAHGSYLRLSQWKRMSQSLSRLAVTPSAFPCTDHLDNLLALALCLISLCLFLSSGKLTVSLSFCLCQQAYCTSWLNSNELLNGLKSASQIKIILSKDNKNCLIRNEDEYVFFCSLLERASIISSYFLLVYIHRFQIGFCYL